MAELLDIQDGGVTIDKRGHKVGLVIFKISTNEAAPENLIAHCLPNYRDTIIKNLKRLNFQKQQLEKNDDARETND
jgi:hypothetical protein